MLNAEQGFKVNLRKFNRKKFSQTSFKFKKVEIISQNSLQNFETPNPFKLLENIDLYYLSKKKSEVNIESVSKRLLKKCRNCNYKKRSCDVDSSSCVALIKNCSKCGKRGHYPQSLCCKASKASKKVIKYNDKEKREPTNINIEVVSLIKNREERS